MQTLRGKTNLGFAINGQDLNINGVQNLYMMLNPSAVIHTKDDGKIDLMVAKSAFNTNQDLEDYLNG